MCGCENIENFKSDSDKKRKKISKSNNKQKNKSNKLSRKLNSGSSNKSKRDSNKSKSNSNKSSTSNKSKSNSNKSKSDSNKSKSDSNKSKSKSNKSKNSNNSDDDSSSSSSNKSKRNSNKSKSKYSYQLRSKYGDKFKSEQEYNLKKNTDPLANFFQEKLRMINKVPQKAVFKKDNLKTKKLNKNVFVSDLFSFLDYTIKDSDKYSNLVMKNNAIPVTKSTKKINGEVKNINGEVKKINEESKKIAPQIKNAMKIKATDSQNIVESSYDDKFNLISALGNLTQVLPILSIKNASGKINLEQLPKCMVPIKLDLITNYNYIINSADQIYQDIAKPESNKAYVFNLRHNLMQVSWAKSPLQWYGENIDLEIRFTLKNSDDGKSVSIIFPLKLVNTIINTENFTDTYFDLQYNNFKTEINNNPHKFDDLNKGIMYNVTEPTLTSPTIKQEFIKKLRNRKKKLNLKKRVFEEKTRVLSEKNIIGEMLLKSIAPIPIDVPPPLKIDTSTSLRIEKSINDHEQKQIIELDKATYVPIEESNLIKEFKKSNDSIKNQPNVGIMRPIMETIFYKKNKAFVKQETVHPIQKVKSELQNFNTKKIDIANIPIRKNLKDLAKTLKTTNFNSVTSEIQNVKYTSNDIDTLFNLNTLIVDSSVIPEYTCCKPTMGNIINIDFSSIQNKILAQSSYYYTTANDGSLILITQPQPYDLTLGNNILKNLSKENLLY
jgi:hypothetical protein